MAAVILAISPLSLQKAAQDANVCSSLYLIDSHARRETRTFATTIRKAAALRFETQRMTI